MEMKFMFDFLHRPVHCFNQYQTNSVLVHAAGLLGNQRKKHLVTSNYELFPQHYINFDRHIYWS